MRLKYALLFIAALTLLIGMLAACESPRPNPPPHVTPVGAPTANATTMNAPAQTANISFSSVVCSPTAVIQYQVKGKVPGTRIWQRCNAS